MNKHTLRLLCILSLNACVSLPVADSNTTLPPATPAVTINVPTVSPTIPYPILSNQHQIDQLGIQVARLEQHIEHLQTRLQQVERASSSSNMQRNTRPARTTQYVPIITTESIAPTQFVSNFSKAQQQYRNGRYNTAINLLKNADSGGNGSDIDRQSRYLLLQSHQRLANCESVINLGNRYVSRFRASAEAPEALDSVAQCQHRLQQKDVARDTWRKLIQTYPDSAAAKRAHQQILKR